MEHVYEILFSITVGDVDFIFETYYPELSEEQRELIKIDFLKDLILIGRKI